MGGEGREGEDGSGDDGEWRDGRQGGAGGGGMGRPMASAVGAGASGGGGGWTRRAEAGGGGEGMAAPGNGRSRRWPTAAVVWGADEGRPQPQRRQPTAGRREIRKPPVHERWPPSRRARLDGPPRLVEGALPPHLVRFQSRVVRPHFVVFSRHPTTSLRLRTSHPPGTIPSPSQALRSRLSSHPPPPNHVPVCLALSAPSGLQTAAVAGWSAAWPLSPPLPPPASSGGGSPKDVPRAPPAPRPGR